MRNILDLLKLKGKAPAPTRVCDFKDITTAYADHDKLAEAINKRFSTLTEGEEIIACNVKTIVPGLYELQIRIGFNFRDA